MSNSNPILVNQPGRVFETDDFRQNWNAGNTEQGLCVEGGPRVDLALVEFFFVLPRLSAEDPGRYPIFTITRGETAETFLRLTYEPSKALFHGGMNAGAPDRDVQNVSLWPASPEIYTGCVLRASVLITSHGLHASIEGVEKGQAPELFGDFQLQWTGRVSDFPPWGACPTDGWFVTSGREGESFPPGFGLSDVRIQLFGPSEKDFGQLPYSGQLDHLVLSLEGWDDEDDEIGEPRGLLRDFASDRIGRAGTWSSRYLANV